jgi:hypothetical protein
LIKSGGSTGYYLAEYVSIAPPSPGFIFILLRKVAIISGFE